MVHLPALIQDLGVILITAALTTLLFKRLRQPVVLGYLIAGFLVGPHVTLIPNVVDTESIHVWADIGVIFLLFGLGLEFSFKKLAKVGKSASLAAGFEIATMIGAGYFLGQALGWNAMDSFFLGAILSVSSTTIIIRAFDELGLKGRGFVSLVFGVLIVEDLAAILLLVVLSTVASPDPVSGMQLLYSALRMAFFLALWFLVGIYFVPGILKRIRLLLTDETLLVVSIGLCLMMVMLATKAGFSPALGAFVMGSILAETREGKRIEHLMIPVRDLFAAVFFVSVGMLIEPKVIQEHFGVIILIILVTIVGKLFGSGFGALLSGRNLKQSMQAGLSLAQIGEFSFLIATVGMTLKATSDFLYPIAIAVSAVTTFTTPYMIKYSDPVCSWLEQKIPMKFRERLMRYEMAMSNESDVGRFGLAWREYGMKVVLNSVVVIAILLLVRHVAVPRLAAVFGFETWIRMGGCVVALGCCAPFLGAIVIGSRTGTRDLKPAELVQLRRLNFGVLLIRSMVTLILIGVIIAEFTSIQAFSGVVLVALGVAIVLFSRHSETIYQAVEKRFLTNLNDKEVNELDKASRQQLAPWDAQLAEFTVSPHSTMVAKRLEESALKEATGATVAMIERGGRKIFAPDRKEMLFPFDLVSLIGTDEQLALAREKIEVEMSAAEGNDTDSFGLESMSLDASLRFVGKSIRECGLREAVNGLIVGIERDGQRILNPDSATMLLLNDRIWIVGDLFKIKAIKRRP